jgi:outer membrane protein OmpA-like peptidoglycan-associated protein/ABC-type nitrate/sulfonate/bicarbonate transport system substrate-binding protein
MSRHVKIVVGLLLLGAAAIIAARFLLPMWQDRAMKATSDARATKGTITLAMDDWVGYAPLCSDQMKTRMRQAGYILECVNDAADYPGRMEKLRKQKVQMAVATVDSYLLNGARENFPATIVAVLDESFGGDAIIARKSRYESLDALKSAPDLKVALTPNSPSEHLAKAAAVHFDIPALKGADKTWQLPTDGAEKAARKLLDGEVDVAVLWEPNVSRVLEKGDGDFVKLLGTEVTAKLIVDILLVSRECAREHPEAVRTLLANYFHTLKYFRDNPAELRNDIKKVTGISGGQVDAMLEGVKWASLTDNAQHWFGISSFGAMPDEGLVETIEGAVRILVGSGDFPASPLPDHDPYRITDSRFVADLFQGGSSAGQFTGTANGPVIPANAAAAAAAFPALSPDGWNKLREVGTLQVRPIIFQSGTATLSYAGKLELDQAAESLKHYPNFRILIKGHTSTRGDAAANQALSLARAEAVKRYLSVTHGLDANRARAVGFGGERPLPRLPGEPFRAYTYRLPRVELMLVTEVL